MPKLSLGIDFGTTTTVVSFRESGMLPQVLKIGEPLRIGEPERPYMPSAVAFLPGMEDPPKMLVGERALHAGRDSELITSVKRCLGCDGHRCTDETAWRVSPKKREARVAANFTRCRGGQLEAGKRSWKPEEIAFFIVQEALRRSLRQIGEKYSDSSLDDLTSFPVNLGCSVAFDLDQRQLIAELANKLGFSRVRLSNVIEEPVAAGVGFAYLEGLRPGRTLIYDFGGGTFDAAVVDVDRDVNTVAVLGSSGVAFLGGDDIDQIIVEYVLDQLSERHTLSRQEVVERLEPGIDERELRLRAEDAKMELSTADSTVATVNLENFGFSQIDLTRTMLETVLEEDQRFEGYPLFSRSLQCVEEVLRRAKAFDLRREHRGEIDKGALIHLPFEQLIKGIDHVLLVGGVTKMPYVRNKLLDLFGSARIHEWFFLDDPVTAVAQGAALEKEYENLVLAAPPYSIVLQCDGDDSAPIELYRAFDGLWQSPRSFSRSDIRFISETHPIRRRAHVKLHRHDREEDTIIYTATPNQYLRIEIDLGAEITILMGGSPSALKPVQRVRAPWQHRVQVIEVPANEYTGHIWDTKSTLTEK